jgi:hypothetical protein
LKDAERKFQNEIEDWKYKNKEVVKKYLKKKKAFSSSE